VVDDEGYRKLAVHVLARAVKDYRRRVPVDQTYDSTGSLTTHTLHTAQAFLLDAQNERLSLWCAWLGVDPRRVCRMVLKGTL